MSRRPLKTHKGRTRIFYLTYQMSKLVISCSTKIVKIKVNLAEKIQVKAHANQDDFSCRINDVKDAYDFYCVLLMNYS